MRDMIRNATTDELCVLKDVLLEAKPHTDTQIDIMCDIVEELVDRDEARPPSDDVRGDYLRLIAEYENVKGDIPKDSEDTAGVIRALSRLDPQAIAIYDVPPDDVKAAWGRLNEKLTGEDAKPPRTKPKPRRRVHPAWIAASIAAMFFLTNAVTAYSTGFNFIAVFARWSQDAMYFVFGEPGEPIEINPVYYRLYDILDELGIDVDLPRFAPDGTKFYTIEPAEPTDYLPIFAWFTLRDDKFSINITPMGSTNTHTERNDEGQSQNLYKDRFFIESNMDRLVALWFQGEEGDPQRYEIRIQGNLTLEELTQILDSI